MWNYVGVERTRTGLLAASAQLEWWSAAADTAVTVAEHEDRNLLALASLIVLAALAREESRGAHYRTDFPVHHQQQAHSRLWSRTPAVLSNPFSTTLKAMA
jgi:L-aspartate oxidase